MKFTDEEIAAFSKNSKEVHANSMKDSTDDLIFEDFSDDAEEEALKELFFDNLEKEETAKPLGTTKDSHVTTARARTPKAESPLRRKEKRSKREPVLSMKKSHHKETDDDFQYIDEFVPVKKHADIKELELEDLIEMELMDSDNSDSSNAVTVQKETGKTPVKIHVIALFYVIFFIFLIYFSIRFLKDTSAGLTAYEQHQPENYMDTLLASFSDIETAGKQFRFPEITYSRFDDTTKLKKDTLSYISSASLTYEKTENYTPTAPTYRIYANGNAIGEVTLNANKEKPFFYFLPHYSYQCSSVDALVTVSPKTYQIHALSTDTVIVNHDELTDADLIGQAEPIEEMQPYSDITEVPTKVTYEIRDLIFEPVVTIKNVAGDYETLENVGNTYHSKTEFTDGIFTASLLLECEVLPFIESYSLYRSNDLSGKDHGFNTIAPYIMKQCEFYENTRNYFTEKVLASIKPHTLPEYCFSSKKIEQYTIYTDTFFSCVVSLDKTIRNEDKSIETTTEKYKCYFVRNPEELSQSDSRHWLIVDVIPLT